MFDDKKAWGEMDAVRKLGTFLILAIVVIGVVGAIIAAAMGAGQ